MRILIGRMGHEANTLSKERGDFERWSRTGWYEGQAFLDYAAGKTDYTSGMTAFYCNRSIRCYIPFIAWPEWRRWYSTGVTRAT